MNQNAGPRRRRYDERQADEGDNGNVRQEMKEANKTQRNWQHAPIAVSPRRGTDGIAVGISNYDGCSAVRQAVVVDGDSDAEENQPGRNRRDGHLPPGRADYGSERSKNKHRVYLPANNRRLKPILATSVPGVVEPREANHYQRTNRSAVL